MAAPALAASVVGVADCLFCGIVDGSVPSVEVHSTPLTYAFADREPAGPVHVLVVPRRHIADIAEVDDGDGQFLLEMLQAARDIAMKGGVGTSGYRLVFNVGDDAGNTVPHLHLHVIGGRQMSWPPG